MADTVLLYQDKTATGGLWKAIDVTVGWAAEGSSPDAVLASLGHLKVDRAAAGSAAPARIPAIYALMLAKATAYGNIAANEMFPGSPTFDVNFLVV